MIATPASRWVSLSPMRRLLFLSLALAGLVCGQTEHNMDAHAGLGSGRQAWRLGDQIVEASIWAVKEGVLTLALENGEKRKVELGALEASGRHQVMAWQKANAAPEGFDKVDATLTLTTLQGQMRYDQEELVVSPGSKVRLVFHNVDDMHHNLILCTPDSAEGMEVAQAAWALGGEGFNKQWIPEHPKVLFASRMVNPHATQHDYFTAPAKSGAYPYVCTLPGHASFMKGTLKVQENTAALSELTYMLYRGNWQKLPDFENLTPVATDHVPSGRIDMEVSEMKNRFGLVFDANLNVPETGEYQFTLASDDGSRLEIGEETVIDLDGIHRPEAPWLFPSRRYPTRPITEVGALKIFYNALEKCSLPNRGGIHCLRHSFASHHLQDGMDIARLQQQALLR